MTQLLQLSEAHRHLRTAPDIGTLFARVVEHCCTPLGYRRGIVLAVDEGVLTAAATGAITDEPSDRLRRALLAEPVRLVRGTRESTVVRHPDREPPRSGASRLGEALGLQSYVIAAVAPDERALAVLVLDRPRGDVSKLDAQVAGACGRLVAATVEHVINRIRAAELADEVRQFSASARALTGELLEAPVVLPSAVGFPRTFPSAGTERETAALHATLTEQELRIAALLAEGLSNPEIAQRLVLSTETVKSHVSRVLRKLDAANRVEAATRFLGLSQS